nr:EOG090X0FQ5 [Triops cancriformis]
MPFMKGAAPIRRTLNFLEASKLVLKNNVRIFSLNYNTREEHHAGAREFVFWHLSQLQYKNPSVQVITFKNLTPSPFITCYLDNGEEILMDIDGKNKDEIVERIKKIICKPDMVLDAETRAAEKKDNPANFGKGCDRHCICEIPGQIPCPSVVPLPKAWRGKYRFQKQDEL